MRFSQLLIYNLCVQMKMWRDIIVWNLNENIGLILIIFYWHTQNILNLTHLQTNLFIYIYIYNKNQIVLSICLILLFWILTELQVIRKHLLFGVTIRIKQLKILDVLCLLCKVIRDLGFLNYNQMYLLQINQTYSPLFITHSSIKLMLLLSTSRSTFLRWRKWV